MREPCSRGGSALAHWAVPVGEEGWKWRISKSHLGANDVQLRVHLDPRDRIDSFIEPWLLLYLAEMP